TKLGMAALPAVLASSAASLAARGAASQFSSPLAQLIVGLATGGGIYLICAGKEAGVVFAPRGADRGLRFLQAPARLGGLRNRGGARHSAKVAGAPAPEALRVANPAHGSVAADVGSETLAGLPLGANLTNSNRQEGWLAQAVAFLERALADRERTLGPDHAHTLASRAHLAYAYGQASWMAEPSP